MATTRPRYVEAHYTTNPAAPVSELYRHTGFIGEVLNVRYAGGDWGWAVLYRLISAGKPCDSYFTLKAYLKGSNDSELLEQYPNGPVYVLGVLGATDEFYYNRVMANGDYTEAAALRYYPPAHYLSAPQYFHRALNMADRGIYIINTWFGPDQVKTRG